MVKDNLNGQMEDTMKENSWTTKKKDMEDYLYLMEGFMKGIGKMELNMEKETIRIKMVIGKKEFGRMAKILNDSFNVLNLLQTINKDKITQSNMFYFLNYI